MNSEHQRPWDPLTVKDIAALFSGAGFFWCVAGGYAMEFSAGRAFRSHGDIDIFVFRKDASPVRHFLSAWDCWMADPPGQLRPWAPAAALPPQAHDVWCRRDGRDDWRFQLMFDESNDTMWRSRRNPGVTRRIGELALDNGDGVRFLAPEIQLFYKAKQRRSKDELDFAAVLPMLGSAQREWLENAIRTTHGSEHEWLHELNARPGP